jgi:hypothetical protein
MHLIRDVPGSKPFFQSGCLIPFYRYTNSDIRQLRLQHERAADNFAARYTFAYNNL